MGSSALSDDKQQAAQLERLLEFYSPDEIPPEPTSALRRIPYNITTGILISNAWLQADVRTVLLQEVLYSNGVMRITNTS